MKCRRKRRRSGAECGFVHVRVCDYSPAQWAQFSKAGGRAWRLWLELFLVFLRNFSEGLRNAGACESKCPADRDAFVLHRARERGTQRRLRHANQCNLFRSGNKTPNRRAIKKIQNKREDDGNHISADANHKLSAVSVDNYRSCNQANARHAAARAPEERMTRRGDTSAYGDVERKQKSRSGWMETEGRKERAGGRGGE